MQHLALEVALVHHVVVDDADAPYACPPRGYSRTGLPSPPGTHAQHGARLQALLALHPELGQDQVPAVAGHLLRGERDAESVMGEPCTMVEIGYRCLLGFPA